MFTIEQFTNLAIAVAVPVLTPIIGGALYSLWSKFSNQATAQDRANMEDEIRAALGAGIAMFPQIAKDGFTTPAAMNDVLVAATTYFRQRFPDRTAQIVAAAGAGDRTEDVHAAVQQTIAARLININPLMPAGAGYGQGPDGAMTSAAPTLPGTLA